MLTSVLVLTVFLTLCYQTIVKLFVAFLLNHPLGIVITAPLTLVLMLKLLIVVGVILMLPLTTVNFIGIRLTLGDYNNLCPKLIKILLYASMQMFHLCGLYSSNYYGILLMCLYRMAIPLVDITTKIDLQRNTPDIHVIYTNWLSKNDICGKNWEKNKVVLKSVSCTAIVLMSCDVKLGSWWCSRKQML